MHKYGTFLRSVFSLNFWWSQAEGMNVRVCLCVGSTLVHLLSFSGPRCNQGDKLCHALICHTACCLSPLPVCLLICSLSSTGDITHATEGEKEESLSFAPERLQQATAPPTGEPRTQMYFDLTCKQLCTHNRLYTVFKEMLGLYALLIIKGI